LAEGHPVEAADHFRRAATLWQDLRLPYEAARSRVGLGLALRALGNEEGSDFELRAALGAFERLGAEPDAERVRGMLAARAALPRGLTAREAEVLRLVAAGKSNREIADELVISQHTVARHLQNMFAKLDVTSRAAATAFAFKHDLA
jgi:DNA-binding NarL/FixJ family response regulator